MNNVKIILIGDMGCGKTSICNIFSKGTFDNNVSSTIGSSYFSKKLQVCNNIVTCELWDTAGSERYRSLIPIYIRNADIVLLVFDLNDRYTFLHIEKWNEILKLHNEDESMNIILIGNKSDLQSKVEDHEIKYICNIYGFDYHKISCYDKNISHIINEIISDKIRDIFKYNQYSFSKINDSMLNIDVENIDNPKKGWCCYF